MTTAIHTIGYEKRNLDGFIDLVRGAVDVLVDVRETPWSHKPGFSKTPLQSALQGIGVEYVHARFAGNPKAIRSEAADMAECLALYRKHVQRHPAIITELTALVERYAHRSQRVALVCFERHPGDCHRGILAEALALRNGWRVEHIAPDGCARLVSSVIGRTAALPFSGTKGRQSRRSSSAAGSSP